MYELLQVVDWLLEKNEGGHLTDKVVTCAYEGKFGLFFKFWVVH